MILLGAQQVGLAPGQRAEGSLPAGRRCGTTLSVPERIRRAQQLRRLPLERLDVAQHSRPFFSQTLDLDARRWHQGGGLSCVAQQLAAALQR